jgi:hypothetical protein
MGIFGGYKFGGTASHIQYLRVEENSGSIVNLAIILHGFDSMADQLHL